MEISNNPAQYFIAGGGGCSRSTRAGFVNGNYGCTDAKGARFGFVNLDDSLRHFGFGGGDYLAGDF